MVNAFRHGMDSQQLQQATSNPNIQRVLQKQASLSKRLSTVAQMSDHQVASLTGGGGGGSGGGMASQGLVVGVGGGAAPQAGPPMPQMSQPQQSQVTAAAAAATRIKIPETSYSHTETAV